MVLEVRLLEKPLCAMPPMAGAELHWVHAAAEVAHVVLENEPTAHVAVQAAVVRPMAVKSRV